MNLAKIRKASERLDPNRYVTFKSRLHHERVAAVLGIALGVSFTVCFVTGVISHVIQYPPSWYSWPSRPAGFYRVTQGVHVATGLASVPLLLAKLWVIFPKLFEWPPINGVAHFLERASLPPLIGGGLFMLATGVANINQWYFFPFFFPAAHYAMSYVTIGALIVHVGAKGGIARAQVSRSRDEDGTDNAERTDGSLTRRGFLYGVFGTSGLVTLFSIGQSFTPLGKVAYLAPRRPHVGPQGLPVNASAKKAGVIQAANADDFRLRVEGRVDKPLTFTLDQLRSLPQHEATLPISCVEGWSQSADWRGVRVRDLMAMAGAPDGAQARVESLEAGGLYNRSTLNRHHVADADTLLALELNGETLHIDHGYPCRLIGPNRPGVLQTKWVHRMVVV